MEVKLIAFTPDPDRVCASAAKLTHSNLAGDQLIEKMSGEQIGRLLDSVIRLGHTSVIEHVDFTFSIAGISRACSHQLVRHRMASYSQQSQRYVKFEESFVEPETILQNEKTRDIFERELKSCYECYQRLLELEVPKEDARYILPNASKTNLFVTMNARSLTNFFELRLRKDAQWEIRELAKRMLEQVCEVAPAIFHDLYARYITQKQ